MFSSALKSLSSNIAANYTIAPQPSSSSGPWNIFDAKRKSTGKVASVFIFDKKALEAPRGGLGGRGSAASTKRLHDEVLERLRKEASSLARLRHPSILELAEPVEETRSGGLMFATEPVTASLASLLQEKDDQESTGGVGGRGSRYVVEEADGTRRRRELDIDELEIQKGLLQLGKGLEFLHESAGLVHANLTPEAVMINAKGDWKLSGLSFCGPHESSTAATSLSPIQLSEVLNPDPRLPRAVQMNLDYTSPDFVLDNHLTSSADIFSLGLLIVALYNSPHTSPLSTSGSLQAYKRLFSSSSTLPSQNNNFLVPKSHPLPEKLSSDLLPRLISRRPAQRLSAEEFQGASYFDNILVSTIRFLDALPAKSAAEKAQFMRGLPRILSQFPKSVLEKKILPVLLEEMKDRELLALIVSNAFAMVKVMPTGKRAFSDQVLPKLKEVFTMTKPGGEKDASKEAGLMVLLENIETAAMNCSGKQFRDDLLPIILVALESPTHALVDAALGTLPHILPVLDFTTIKTELFPVIANVFAKTSSLNIKIRGLEAFYVLCGGGTSSDSDGLNGFSKNTNSSSAILDKFTVQEKVMPLLKGIKTKEPGVMMAALRVSERVGEVADTDFLALELLPCLWQWSLGPLLGLQDFERFMALIRKIGERVEREQVKKLREMRGGDTSATATRNGTSSIGARTNGFTSSDPASDFETLVSGRKAIGTQDLMNDTNTPTFSWQTQRTPQPQIQTQHSLHIQAPFTRAVTPDQQSLAQFEALTPASNQFSVPLQPSRATSSSSVPPRPPAQAGIDWSAALQQKPVPANGVGPSSVKSSFALAPPPGAGVQANGGQTTFAAAAPPMSGLQASGGQKSGLDRYESLI